MYNPATKETVLFLDKEKQKYQNLLLQNKEKALHGLAAKAEHMQILAENGKSVLNTDAFNFINDDANNMHTAHPLLWEQGKYTALAGLFEICPSIWQIRGFDISNMTLIKGKKGYIVVDAMRSAEAAEQALLFAYKHLPELPVTAVIITHAHADHFGGIKGLLPYCVQDVPIIAPSGYLEAIEEESVLTAPAMRRRAAYQFGATLKPDPAGHIGCGLGTKPSMGSNLLIKPNDYVTQNSEIRIIDGVEFIFELTPEAECPAEFCFYLPAEKSLCMAEIISHTLHNVLPFRGAKVRSALLWSQHIKRLAQKYAGTAETMFLGHHWAVYGNEEIKNFLEEQSDLYKFIHDQTIRLINHGLTPAEIAEKIELPEKMLNTMSYHGFYGSVQHNVKAVYQYYLGWYDANPANLNPLPPAEFGAKLLAFLGDEEKILKHCKEFYDKGEYRFLATLLNYFIFSAPSNENIKQLLADTYEQLGYQSECATWRNPYLMARNELRFPERKGPAENINGVLNMPLLTILNWLATKIDPERAGGKECIFNVLFTEPNEIWEISLKNSVLNYQHIQKAEQFFTISEKLFKSLLANEIIPEQAAEKGEIAKELAEYLAVLLSVREDPQNFWFNIVLP